MSKDEKKTKSLMIRMKPSEHESLAKKAKKQKVSLSRLLVESALALIKKNN